MVGLVLVSHSAALAEGTAILAREMRGEDVVLRTLEVGGDKPLAYLPTPPEANPFLGVRGLRLGLERPEMLRTDRLEVGVMIEVPAAALAAGSLAALTDFFSIGTNDLAQYTLAAERGDDRVAALADAASRGSPADRDDGRRRGRERPARRRLR